jgi:hypothetical protein
MSEATAGRRRVLAGFAGLGIASLPAVARADRAPDLSPKRRAISLGAGRSVLEILAPAGAFVSIAVTGPRDSLLGLTFTGPSARVVRRCAPLDEDGLLPRVVSFRTDDVPTFLTAVVDVLDPVRVDLAWATDADDREPTPKGLKQGLEHARPLIGFPAPASDKLGYGLAVPGRYLFARIDVVRSLVSAFERTRKKFKSDPIYVGDASQWDGRRPKSDLGEPRHISHEGGCDIDLGIPAIDTFPSTLRDHCRGVRLEPDRFGCSPGTAKGVDFDRLAFLLGVLIDEAPGRVVKVFLDDVYRREIIRCVPKLFEKRFVKEAALTALGEDGLLVASPWHTDHIHVRFSGEKGRALFAS